MRMVWKRPDLMVCFVCVCLSDGGRCRLAGRAAGRRAAGVREGARRAEERPLQPAGAAGHQRRHHPPQPAGAPAGRAGLWPHTGLNAQGSHRSWRDVFKSRHRACSVVRSLPRPLTRQTLCLCCRTLSTETPWLHSALQTGPRSSLSSISCVANWSRSIKV